MLDLRIPASNPLVISAESVIGILLPPQSNDDAHRQYHPYEVHGAVRHIIGPSRETEYASRPNRSSFNFGGQQYRGTSLMRNCHPPTRDTAR